MSAETAAPVPREGPLLLSVDTATARGVVVLARGGRVLAASMYAAGSDHAEKLLDHVGAVLRTAGVTLGDVQGYGVGIGPGSFTGVRAGLTTVKAFALALPAPVAAVPTLATIAAGSRRVAVAEGATPVGIVLSAGRDDCFVQCLGGPAPPVEPVVVAHGALTSWFQERSLRYGAGREIAAFLADRVVDLTEGEGLPTPAALAELTARGFLEGRALEGGAAAFLDAAYARPPQITAPRARSRST